jgi:hypothetical protein
MTTIGGTGGAPAAGGWQDADPAKTDELVRELGAIKGHGLDIAFLDGAGSTRDLAQKLLADGTIDADDVKRMVKDANDFGRVRDDERKVFTTLLRDHAARFTPEAREALARHFGIPLQRPQPGVPAPSVPASPHDPVSERENAAVNQVVDSFKDWDKYPYQAVVVPGFTPLDAKDPVRMHPEQRKRLEVAKRDFETGKAPFILVSGGNVHPDGTPYNEALEMKAELIRMGVPADRIIVDAQARHSTTNLRNAGRYMLEHGMSKALVASSGSQDFYFSHPWISTFHLRCMSELGYRVGKLSDAGDRNHSEFRPDSDVKRFNLRDPRDP